MAGFKPFYSMLKRAIFALFVVFVTNSAFAACTGGDKIDVLGDGTQCEDVKFTLQLEKTSSHTSSLKTFYFDLSPKGTFYVDCGNGGTLSGTGVSGKTITRTDTTVQQYSCTWSSWNAGDSQNIRFAGSASNTTSTYTTTTASTGTTMKTISFYSGADDPAKTENATLIETLNGSLSALFPRVTASGVNTNAQPTFYRTFYMASSLWELTTELFEGYTTASNHMFRATFEGCTRLDNSAIDGLFPNMTAANYMFYETFKSCTGITSIPSDLFSGVSGNGTYMFRSTFEGCTGITTVPAGLFSGRSARNYMFNRTFYGCTGLTSIPKDLFSSISGSSNATSLFNGTFDGCTNLAKITDGQSYTTYIPGTFLSGVTATNTNTGQNMFASTGLASTCPSETVDVTPSWATNAGKPWCSPGATITYNMGSGGVNYSNAPQKYLYDTGVTIDGVPTNYYGYVFTGWTGNGVTIPSSSITIGPSDTGAKTITANWAEPKFTITTSSTDYFLFDLSAKGKFYVNCGNDGTVNIGTGVNYVGNGWYTITRSNTTLDTYACSWADNPAIQTIQFSGTVANGPDVYNSSTSTPAISFYTSSVYYGTGDANDNAAQITAVSGNLSAMFPIVPGNVSGQPRFYQTFAHTSNLTSVPDTLFANYTTPVSYMFNNTFSNSGLTSVPALLFSRVTGAAEGLFFWTFQNSNGLASIPKGLFAGISGSANDMFNGTFYECNVLGSITDGQTSTNYVPGDFLSAVTGGTNVVSSMFSGTALANPCPSGTVNTTPSRFSDAYKPWCSPGGTITYNLGTGGTNYNGAPTTYVYGTGVTINGVPTRSGYIFKGWTGNGVTTPASSITIGTNDTGDKTITANWEQAKFTLNTLATNSFQFKLSAAGTFYVDCGNDGTLSVVSGNGTVSGKTITKTGTSWGTFVCSWDDTETQTVRFDGVASGYSATTSAGAITFNITAADTDTNAEKIAGISGSLGAIFGTIDGTVSPTGAESQPRFYGTFRGTTNLAGTIPDELFYGVHGTPISYMFNRTFRGCSSLTGKIPETLFCQNTSNPSASNCIYGAPKDQMFYMTFHGCSGLTGNSSTGYAIPAKLFAGIRGDPSSTSSVFGYTFYGCSGLTGKIPETLFCQNTSNPSTSNCIYGAPGTNMFNSTFYNTGITHIDKNMFAGISGTSAEKMFYRTFKGCSSLSYIDDNFNTTATTYIPSDFLGAITDGSVTDDATEMFTSTGLTSPCPAGTSTATPSWATDAAKPWCSPCAAGTYTSSAGQSSCSVCATGTYADTPGATSCSACPSGYNANTGTTATDHDDISDCKIQCSAGTQVATANAACSIPSGSWYTAQHYVNYGSTSSSSVQECPNYYRITDADKKPVSTDHDEKSDCKITCNAGYVVATADAACTVPSSGYQTGSHTVSAGSVTPTAADSTRPMLGTWYSCLTNYSATGKVATNHDNRNDCKITCAAGTRIASANATSCTTPTGSWYIGSNTVSAGSTSSPSNCSTGYSTPNTTTATDHDSASDCAAHQINIVWDGVTSQNALANDVRQVSYDGDIKTPSSANLAQQTGAQFVGWKFDKS